MSSLGDLPVETLFNIFEGMSFTELINLRGTNRYYKEIVDGYLSQIKSGDIVKSWTNAELVKFTEMFPDKYVLVMKELIERLNDSDPYGFSSGSIVEDIQSLLPEEITVILEDGELEGSFEFISGFLQANAGLTYVNPPPHAYNEVKLQLTSDGNNDVEITYWDVLFAPDPSTARYRMYYNIHSASNWGHFNTEDYLHGVRTFATAVNGELVIQWIQDRDTGMYVNTTTLLPNA